jgi:hypothetical protein
MENNKLIAEFMGLSIKEGVCYYTDADDMFPMGIEVEEPYLPYDTSWDWLMPVVEKVFVLSEDEEAWRMDIESGLTTLNRDETYRAVVEFIKQYNK